MKKELALTALALTALVTTTTVNAEERLNLDALNVSKSGVVSVNKQVVGPSKLSAAAKQGRDDINIGNCGNCGKAIKALGQEVLNPQVLK